MDIVQRLNQFHPKVIDLSLGRIERLLGILGNPQEKIPPVIHVAGTNGKGSTIAFLQAIAEAAGLSVHCYTSPHLVRFNERIVIKGETIGDGELLDLIDECEKANGDQPITYFEITTALAFLAFSRSAADLTLLETGLGGRLDATNVITQPAVTILTPISLDHAGFLGDKITGIAAEKAAIMKNNVPCISARQDDNVATVIRDYAEKIGAPLYWETEDSDLPQLSLTGDHQIQNARLARTALKLIDDPRITENAIRSGLACAQWPGRLQHLTRGPLVAALPDDWDLWLDGGHNPAAGRALAHWAEKASPKPLQLIAGILNTKDAKGFLAPLAGQAESLHAVAISNEEASLAPEDIQALAQELDIPAYSASSLSQAIASITQNDLGGRILICGSLYLAGQVLAENQ